MKCVVVIGYNRPKYFERVIKSLESNPESQNLPFFFFLDGGPESSQAKYNEIIEKYKFPLKTIINRDRNLGCGLNIIDAREHVFDRLGFDAAMIFEDDLIPADNYIKTVFNMLDQMPSAMCQAWTPDHRSRDEKLKFIGEIKISEDNFWGYALTRETWGKIKHKLYEYRDLFLRNKPYRQRNDKEIRDWIQAQTNHSYFIHPNVPTGQDAITNLALLLADVPRYSTTVNYGIYIGKEGIHATLEIFNSKGFQKVNPDPLPTPEEFYYAK